MQDCEVVCWWPDGLTLLRTLYLHSRGTTSNKFCQGTESKCWVGSCTKIHFLADKVHGLRHGDGFNQPDKIYMQFRQTWGNQCPQTYCGIEFVTWAGSWASERGIIILVGKGWGNPWRHHALHVQRGMEVERLMTKDFVTCRCSVVVCTSWLFVALKVEAEKGFLSFPSFYWDQVLSFGLSAKTRGRCI